MSRPTLAERVVQEYEASANAYRAATGCGDVPLLDDALAALVRAGNLIAGGLQEESPGRSRTNSIPWDTALSALAAALGVTEEA